MDLFHLQSWIFLLFWLADFFTPAHWICYPTSWTLVSDEKSGVNLIGVPCTLIVEFLLMLMKFCICLLNIFTCCILAWISVFTHLEFILLNLQINVFLYICKIFAIISLNIFSAPCSFFLLLVLPLWMLM